MGWLFSFLVSGRGDSNRSKCNSTCSCGDTKTETIPATGHNVVDGKCTNDGCDYEETTEQEPKETTIEMNIYANQGTMGTKEITWTSGVVTFKNAQKSSTSAIRTSDSDHFRVYAKSEVTITVNGGNLKQIVITCTSSDYVAAMNDSLKSAGYTAAVSGSTVTVTDISESTITFIASAQTRLNKIVVTYMA